MLCGLEAQVKSGKGSAGGSGAEGAGGAAPNSPRSLSHSEAQSAWDHFTAHFKSANSLKRLGIVYARFVAFLYEAAKAMGSADYPGDPRDLLGMVVGGSPVRILGEAVDPPK
jgi:hypothetical protein